jgi:para-nitrobenzyl esterase
MAPVTLERITTDKGVVAGETTDGITVFKGIPYAAAPVGDLRWMPPQDAIAWEGELGGSFGPACPQPTFESMEGSDPVGPTSEDCLYLNVTTSGVDPDALKPVMFWIHGGAFKLGSGTDLMYDGAHLAAKDVVVVTINYRLGLLGFFAHPALDAERGKNDGTVNFGLFDVIKALQWTQANIELFGGDPGNVTIFGQSAGAMSVLSMIASPLTRPPKPALFHKAIAQSPYAIPEQSRATALATGVDVATKLFGLDGVDATAEELRAAPEALFTEKLMPPTLPEVGVMIQVPVPALGPSPVDGDDVLPNGIRAAFQANLQAKVPLIVGSNDDEGSILGPFNLRPGLLLDVIIAKGGDFAKDIVGKLRAGYESTDELTDADRCPDEEVDGKDPCYWDRLGSLILRDMLFTAQARWMAGNHIPPLSTSKSRRYYFSYVPELLREDQPHGVPHGGEIVFPFMTGAIGGATRGKFTAADEAVAAKVCDYWVSFAKTGTPAAEGEPAWPLHRLAEDNTLIIGETGEPGKTFKVQKDFRDATLTALTNLYPILEAVLKAG